MVQEGGGRAGGERGDVQRRWRGLAALAAISAAAAMALVSASGSWGGVNDEGGLGEVGQAWLDPMASTPVTLEGRGRRGPDLGKAPHPTGDIHTTASPHAGGPLKTAKPDKSAKAEDGTREEAQAMIGSVLPKAGSKIWRTEQAMKKQLDDDTGSKAGNLWKQTVHIVDKDDGANSHVLSSFAGGQSGSATPVSSHHGPHHAKAGAEHRLRTKSMTMKQRLEAQLNAKVQQTLGAMNGHAMQQEQAKFAQKNGGHTADAARAHASMKIQSMKKMLQSQLDTSVKSVVDRAKQLGTFSNSAQLEKRLKAELDQKAKKQQKELLQSQSAAESASESLHSTRKKLSSKVSRAQAVRDQLTKEMREENAIRRQLNMAANAQGKKMLHDAITGDKKKGGKAAPHSVTKEDMEAAMEKKLDQSTKTEMSGSKGDEDKVTMKEFGKLGKGQRKHLEEYLRQKLIKSDSNAQKSIYKQSVESDLVKSKDSSVADKNSAMTKAEMRLFQDSMHAAKHNAKLSSFEKAHAKQEGAIIHTEKGLLDKVMKLSKDTGVPVKSDVRAPGTAPPPPSDSGPHIVKDMAHASGHVDDGSVHDMAHASGRHDGGSDLTGERKRITLGLGHQADLRAADQVRREQAHKRKAMVKFAQHEDEEAVE